MKQFLKVKPFQETLGKSMCGPASLKIVLAYYGVSKSEQELAQLTSWDEKLGVNDKGIKEAAKSLGLRVKIKDNSSFDEIEEWLKEGVPIIVDWFTTGRKDYPESEMADGHYSVVCGLDKKFIYLQDPEIGRVRKIKRSDFERVWFDFQGEFIKKSELIIRQIIAIYK